MTVFVSNTSLQSRRLSCAAASTSAPTESPTDWRKRAKPIKPGGAYPAKEHCSNCGLCDTHYVAKVKEACAFLGDGMLELLALPQWLTLQRQSLTGGLWPGMSKIDTMEPRVHGRGRYRQLCYTAFIVSDHMLHPLKQTYFRDLNNLDDLHFGVHTDMLYAKAAPPVQGAQWTGIVTRIAMAMLESGQVRCCRPPVLRMGCSSCLMACGQCRAGHRRTLGADGSLWCCCTPVLQVADDHQHIVTG